MSAAKPPRAALLSRIAASVVGSYVFVWGFTALGIALGVAAGMRYADAQMLVYLLAFLIFVTALCWSYAARNLWRLWAVLVGGGVTMTVSALLLAAALT